MGLRTGGCACVGWLLIANIVVFIIIVVVVGGVITRTLDLGKVVVV